MSDTPKTDSAAFSVDAGAPEVESSRMEEVVTADFARAQERRIQELETAVANFIKGMDEAEQIRDLVTKISGNPVNGVSAYVWWCSRYLNVACFLEARDALVQP